jgi:uncharacterized protein
MRYNVDMAKQSKAIRGYVQPYRFPSPNIPLSAIKRFARRIGSRFHPEKIILFGSYAYGTPHAESDVDLLVIMQARNAIDQAVRICAAFEEPFALDLIVRTPKQIENAIREDDRDWFVSEVITKGKILYEAPNTVVGAQGGRGLGGGRHVGRSNQPAQKRLLLSLPTDSRKVSQSSPSRTRRGRAANA